MCRRHGGGGGMRAARTGAAISGKLRGGRSERLLARRSPAVPGPEDEVAPRTLPGSSAHLPDTLPAGAWHGRICRIPPHPPIFSLRQSVGTKCGDEA